MGKSVDRFEYELAELKGKLRILCDGNVKKDLSAEQWQKTFHDVSPKQLYSCFEKAAGKGNKMVITVTLDNHKPELADVEVRHNSSWFAHERNNAMRFRILGDGNAKLSSIFLRGKDQHKGIATRYLAARLGLLQELGVHTAYTEAIELGSYIWAKYGYTPATADDWIKLQREITSRFREGDKIMFSGMRYDISKEMPSIKRILGTDFANLPDCFSKLAELKRPIGTYEVRDALSGETHTVPLNVGMALLINSNWNGKMELMDGDLGFERFKYCLGIGAEAKRAIA